MRSNYLLKTVFGKKKNKEEHRYYLLPGMARSNRKRHAEILRWSLVFGIIVSVLIGVMIYFANKY